MFSYMYADSRGNMNYAIGAKTKAGIESAALEYINNMIKAEVGYTVPGTAIPKETQEVLDACKAKDANLAIDAWNKYAITILKHGVSCHKIEPFQLVE